MCKFTQSCAINTFKKKKKVAWQVIPNRMGLKYLDCYSFLNLALFVCGMESEVVSGTAKFVNLLSIHSQPYRECCWVVFWFQIRSIWNWSHKLLAYTEVILKVASVRWLVGAEFNCIVCGMEDNKLLLFVALTSHMLSAFSSACPTSAGFPSLSGRECLSVIDWIAFAAFFLRGLSLWTGVKAFLSGKRQEAKWRSAPASWVSKAFTLFVPVFSL